MRYSILEQKAAKLYKKAFIKNAQMDSVQFEEALTAIQKLIAKGLSLSEDLDITNTLFSDLSEGYSDFIKEFTSGDSESDNLSDLITYTSGALQANSAELEELEGSDNKDIIVNIIKALYSGFKQLSSALGHSAETETNEGKATTKFDTEIFEKGKKTQTVGPTKEQLEKRLFILENPDSPEAREYKIEAARYKANAKRLLEGLSEAKKETLKKYTRESQERSVRNGNEKLEDLLNDKSTVSSRKAEIERIINIDQAMSQAKKLSSIVKDPNEYLYYRKLRIALDLLDPSEDATPQIEEYFKKYEEAKANRKQYQKGFGKKEWQGTVLADFASVQNNFATFLDPNKSGQFVDWSFNHLLMPNNIYGLYIKRVESLKAKHLELMNAFKAALKEAGLRTYKGENPESVVVNTGKSVDLEESLVQNKQQALETVNEISKHLKENCRELIILEQSKEAIIKNITDTKPIEVMARLYALIQKRTIIGDGIVLTKKGIFGSQTSGDKVIEGDSSEKAKALGGSYIVRLTEFTDSLDQVPLNESASVKSMVSKLRNILEQLSAGLNS